MTDELTEVSRILNDELELPDGRVIEIQPMKTSRAIHYLRRYSQVLNGGVEGILVMGDLIEEVGEELGIKDELMELDIDAVRSVIMDFFAWVITKVTGASSASERQLRATSQPTDMTPGAVEMSNGGNSSS